MGKESNSVLVLVCVLSLFGLLACSEFDSPAEPKSYIEGGTLTVEVIDQFGLAVPTYPVTVSTSRELHRYQMGIDGTDEALWSWFPTDLEFFVSGSCTVVQGCNPPGGAPKEISGTFKAEKLTSDEYLLRLAVQR